MSDSVDLLLAKSFNFFHHYGYGHVVLQEHLAAFLSNAKTQNIDIDIPFVATGAYHQAQYFIGEKKGSLFAHCLNCFCTFCADALFRLIEAGASANVCMNHISTNATVGATMLFLSLLPPQSPQFSKIDSQRLDMLADYIRDGDDNWADAVDQFMIKSFPHVSKNFAFLRTLARWGVSFSDHLPNNITISTDVLSQSYDLEKATCYWLFRINGGQVPEKICLPWANRSISCQKWKPRSGRMMLSGRSFDICIALQSLRFPALVTCEILQFLHQFNNIIKFHDLWRLATFVKHYKERKERK
jgi:hypothetical protein